MKGFKNLITLTHNSRGCWILDTTKGCSGCNSERPNGCYGECYAKNIAARYGRDFSNVVERDFPKDGAQFRLFDFDDARRVSNILHAIEKIDMPFIRIGELGDPSDNWNHTLDVCNIISGVGKQIVLITKHWNVIPEYLLPQIENLVVNTSISALDSEVEIRHRLLQYLRLRKYCNSVLRIVSCDFNTQNPEGYKRSKVQEELFKHRGIDTVFRPKASNPLVLNGIIRTRKVRFMRSEILASQFRDDAYLGMCTKCPDMCGLRVA